MRFLNPPVCRSTRYRFLLSCFVCIWRRLSGWVLLLVGGIKVFAGVLFAFRVFVFLEVKIKVLKAQVLLKN